MKAILTLCLVLVMSAGTLAQNARNHAETQYHQMDLVLDGRPVPPVSDKQIEKADIQKVARLYRFKNARVKAELSFRTKKKNLTA
ncbi:hypothetical protein [Muriicola jejuensis]|uniref:DUF3857 domain-containing protein n=1 Tax=Muriicola jejuensis TaxID=504488 RepID=A0A6P0U924_9FLAO|nr:hypothetical protein [Muriicola jejuensis]NER09052.1 hypothetical protein [Muriicola jejuensis]